MAKDYGVAVLLDFYGELLTEKRRDFVNYYYNDDLSLAEIAENEGLSRQGVRDTIKKAEEQLRGYEAVLHTAEKFRAVSEKAELIASLAGAITDGGEENLSRAARIKKAALELKELG